MRLRSAFIGVGLAVLTVAAFAQTPASTEPSFEVASVKQNKSPTDEMVGGMLEPGGRFTVINTPLREIIRVAFRVQRDQIVGGPNWIDSDRFDIAAKANGTPTPLQLQMMLQALLAERFKMATHRETRQLPVYALVMANSGSKLGPHLRHSAPDCIAEATAPHPNPTPPIDPAHPCGSAGGPFGQTTARGLTMAQIAFGLVRIVGRAVVDRTGLAGYFDYELTWTPDRMPPSAPGTPDRAADPNGSTIFTALPEQLGLKLESSTAPFDVVVIDHVERPTEN